MKFELTFKVVLLFSYQGFQLSLAKAFIFYHITLFLSRTFLKKTFFIFFRRFLFFAMLTFIYYHMIFNLSRSFFVFFQDSCHFSFKNEFLMCNAYYIIIIAELRQAFFGDFFIFSESTRYCIFSVFLSFTLHIRLVELLFFYQHLNINNINLQKQHRIFLKFFQKDSSL